MACELASVELKSRIERYGALRDQLWQGIRAKISGVRRNGCESSVLCNTLNVEFEETAGDILLQSLDIEGVAVSAGAACHSGSISPSHVLSAMGRTPVQARGVLRLSVGLGVTTQQVDKAVAILSALTEKVRATSRP